MPDVAAAAAAANHDVAAQLEFLHSTSIPVEKNQSCLKFLHFIFKSLNFQRHTWSLKVAIMIEGPKFIYDH